MMGSVPLEFAVTPRSWCYITDVEILKRAGRINIKDVRLIQLMHPEYQINNKLVGKKVLVNAEICNEVADEQHGSRKHRQAGLLGLNKVECMMRSVPLEFIFTPPSWCYITDVEILKRAGRINIEDMRLI